MAKHNEDNEPMPKYMYTGDIRDAKLFEEVGSRWPLIREIGIWVIMIVACIQVFGSDIARWGTQFFEWVTRLFGA